MNDQAAEQADHAGALAAFFQIDCQWQQGELHFLLARFDRCAYQKHLFALAQLEYPTELNSAVAKRQAEYLAGRYSVRILQRQLGLQPAPVRTASDRSPIWPAGQLGSISHTDGWVLAALAVATGRVQRTGADGSNGDDCWGASRQLVGVDAELLFSAAQQQLIAAMIHTSAEQQLGLAAGLDRCQLSTLVFSAKESLYKALSSQCRRIMEFSAARLVALTDRHFVLELTEHWSTQWRQGCRVQGQYQWFGPLVCTWLTGVV